MPGPAFPDQRKRTVVAEEYTVHIVQATKKSAGTFAALSRGRLGRTSAPTKKTAAVVSSKRQPALPCPYPSTLVVPLRPPPAAAVASAAVRPPSAPAPSPPRRGTPPRSRRAA